MTPRFKSIHTSAIAAAVAIFAPFSHTKAAENDPVRCQIEVQQGSSSNRTIIATATAVKTPQSGFFTIVVSKQGLNTAVSTQSGDFELAGGQSTRLATVRMNVERGETLKISGKLNGKFKDIACELK